MRGNAIKLSRFQDQWANRITVSKQTPLSSRTARLKRTSFQRRNANNSERRTSEIIGTSSFHMFFFTLQKIALPSSSQPDNQTFCRGNSDSSGASRERFAGPALVRGLI